MTRTASFLHTLLLPAVLAVLAPPDLLALPQSEDVRDLAGKATIGLRDAIARALRVRPGRAVEAELEVTRRGDDEEIVWEVTIVAEGQALHEVVLDALDGEVRADTPKRDADEEEERLAFIRALRHAELTLDELVARAEEIVKGKAVCAELDDGKAGPVCEVVFVNGRHVVELNLEARAGHLIGIELRRDRPARDRGEEGDEEDEGTEARAPTDGARAFRAPSLTPLADGVVFSHRVDHPYFPLSLVRHAVLASGSERVIRSVLDETRTVCGVACVVLKEEEYEDGELAEISYNFFAQDPQGNVYYFGEDVDDYEDGKVTGHGGAWRVGVNANEPCLYMPADPRPGFAFKRENSPPAAEEFDEVVGIGARLEVPAGRFDELLVIREGDHPGRWTEKKYYARGIGLISENGELNLVSYAEKPPSRK